MYSLHLYILKLIKIVNNFEKNKIELGEEGSIKSDQIRTAFITNKRTYSVDFVNSLYYSYSE